MMKDYIMTNKEFINSDVLNAYSIGETTAKKLRDNNIKTVMDLAISDFRTLAFILNITGTRSKSIINNTNMWIKDY